MSFSVHQVSQRAGGGEIARTRKLEAVAPVIGRGTDCDIHLPDLAVDLRHARLSEGAGGLVTIEALGELGFEVDGRFTRHAEFDPVKGAEVVIGRNRLVLSRDGSGGVKIAIGKAEGAADTATTADEAAIFTPPSAVFGRRPLAWTLGLAILLLCLAVPTVLFLLHDQRTVHADQQWTSGPLSRSHAFLQTNCQACHTRAFVSARDDACLSCHAANRNAARIAATPRVIRDPRSPPPLLILAHAPADRLLASAPYPADLPGQLTEWVDKAVDHPNDRCASCHVEHIPAPGSLAGATPRDKPLLKTVNGCADCHASLRSRLPGTTLRDTADWGRHPDFRPYLAAGFAGGKVMVRRETLAGAPPTATGLVFSHKVHLLPAGGVARMALELGPTRGFGHALDCGACHRPDPRGRGFLPVNMDRDCRSCHTMAFARDRSGLRVLPHGSVQKLIAFSQSFYGGRPAGPAMRRADDGRRRPGEAVLTPDASGLNLARSSPSQAAALVRASAAPGGACAFCHRISPPVAGSLAFVVDPTPQLMRHMPAGGFDHGVTAHHQDALGRPTCGACHAAMAARLAGAVLLPPIARCAACHGARRAAAPASSRCAECHDYHAPGQPQPTLRERREIVAWRSGSPDSSRPAVIATLP